MFRKSKRQIKNREYVRDQEMSGATVGNVDEQSLSDLIVSARKDIILIEDHDARTSQEYKVWFYFCLVF